MRRFAVVAGLALSALPARAQPTVVQDLGSCKGPSCGLGYEIQRCYGHALKPEELERCVADGGYNNWLVAEEERKKQAAEARYREQVEAKKRAAAERRAREEAERQARLKAARDAARRSAREEAARLAARTPEQVEADRRAEERAKTEELARHEELVRTAAAVAPRVRENTLETVRGMLKDPDSARFRDVRVIFDRRSERVVAVCGKVSGTNSFGARINGGFVYGADSGNVYLETTDGWKSGVGLSAWSRHCR